MAAAVAVVPIHATVPGRVRVRVAGLRRDPRMAERLVRRLAGDRVVVAVSADPRTGNALVHYDRDRLLAQVLERVAAAASGAEVPAAVGVPPAWHAMPATAVAAAFATDPGRGLTAPEARRRLAEHGPNRLPIPRRRGVAAILAGQVLTLPVGLLAASALVSLLTGGVLDAVAILAVIVLNGAIGTATEVRTERLIAALERGRRPTAAVLRDGRTALVESERVVPGDVLVLTPGATVAADARLLATDGLLMDESVLTGESLPVPKHPAGQAAATALADRRGMVWRGTLVGAGGGTAVAVATGRDTEVGRIQGLVGDLAAPHTPLQRQLDAMGRKLVAGSAGLCLGVLALGLLRGAPLARLLRSVTALGVAALPEGLPTVATTALALAVRDLRRHGVLVRRLEVVESMGSTSTVFFDKTGTLTLNRMSVAEVAAEGAGAALRLWQVAVLCSDAAMGEGGRIEGSSTEAALLRAAVDAGIDASALRAARPRLSERMRDDRRQSMATLHDLGGHRRMVAVKGSPPEVLDGCARRWDGGPVALSRSERAAIAQANEVLAERGLRVLGFAMGEGVAGEDIEAAGGLTWLGLAALADPPRPGAEEFIASLHRAGIDTVMLTGDQAATARAIADRMGLDTVFARILPGDKLRLVQARRAGGRVVAMVGDGVNDAPALKAADIGITLGRHGAEAARDLSDIVLENDELAGLMRAIERGRATHDNIRRAVRFLLSTNLAEIIVTAGATGFGLGGGLEPMHLLWINLVTDVLPGLALSQEPPEAGVDRQPPRDPAAPLIGRQDVPGLAGEAAALAAAVLAAHGLAGDAGRAGTLSTTAMVVGQMLYAEACRGPAPAGPNPWLRLAVAGTLAVHGLALGWAPLRRLLRFAPLTAAELATAAAAGAAARAAIGLGRAAAQTRTATRARAERSTRRSMANSTAAVPSRSSPAGAGDRAPS
ncbi:MAG: HAD-IC family P-type ATPase [Actinomycetota bacterium]